MFGWSARRLILIQKKESRVAAAKLEIHSFLLDEAQFLDNDTSPNWMSV